MNLTVFLTECIVCVMAFTCVILIPLCRNPVWWSHDYPRDIQEKYFETHERIPTQPLSAPVVIKKGFALLLCLALSVGLAMLAGARDFRSAFSASYGLWLVIDWYDCFFLDWVLFANLKQVRLPGTEYMDKEYHQKKYHFVHSLIGMALGLIPCLLCGCIVTAIS